MGKPFVVGAVVFAALALVGSAGADSIVSVGSPTGPFAQNKQNEPGLAIDPLNPSIVVAGSNDEIDLEACAAGNPTTCPFTPGVGLSGVYFSSTGGASWSQPTYSGWSARGCLGPATCAPAVGPIGTLPGYFEAGLVSDGDPALAFGPRPDSTGRFSWSNGVRLYYANLAENFSAIRSEETFSGFEAVAVSRTDDIAGAAAGHNSAWMAPVIVTKQNTALFSDKEAIWADNASSSPFFGNVYECNASFRAAVSRSPSAEPEPIMFGRSTDGGSGWQVSQLSSATNTNQTGGRQDCTVRTDSHGAVYVFWQGGIPGNPGSAVAGIFMTRSTDGGKTFGKPQVVATFTGCGHFDPNTGRLSFDGLGGARTGTYPSVDIANGAPTGAGASNAIVLSYCSGTTPTNTAPGSNEQALVQISTNAGASWSTPLNAAPIGDRPDFPAVAISPNGSDVYLGYDNFLQPWQNSTITPPRLMQAVVRHADLTNGTLGAFSDLFRGPTGDSRGSSQNGLTAGFLGDYNSIEATNSAGVAVYNDVRNASDCAPIDAFRADLSSTRPAPGTDCPATFGNSDIFGGTFTDPTP
jgi:hypothetical protein